MRIGDFPRLQIAVFGVLIILLLFIFARPLKNFDLAIILVLFLCAVYQIYRIIPYVPIYPNQVEWTEKSNPKKTIKVLVSNVLIENKKTSNLLNLIEDINPDVILLAEPDKKWIKSIQSLKKNYPYAVEHPLDNAYGIALYSRLELIDPQVKFLVEDDTPSIHTDIKISSGYVVKFYGIHPRPPVPGEATSSTERDAELILVGKMVKNSNTPAIIAGDLNDVAWSRTTNLF